MTLTMTTDEREQFLAGLHVGVVSFPRADKGPLTVPIWYDYAPGGEVWMITGRSSIKGKLAARAQRISLCAQNESPPYQYVSVEGAITLRDVREGELLHMAVRYLGEKMGTAYAANSTGEDSMVVSFRPETWFTVDYSKADMG